MADDLRRAFQAMFNVEEPHTFQLQVADLLLNQRRSVILQAPTGSGKTKAALFPFLHAWRNPDPAQFPRQGIYVIPLRVLADQFATEFTSVSGAYVREHSLGMQGDVRVQTGAQSDDPRFEADLTFTTIDQFLSSFLTIPYSLGNRLANLNAGALIGGFLVFDEFHLFPVDDQGNGALATTLHILNMLKGVTPFVLMTATFSQRMIAHLCTVLDAVSITLTKDDIAKIPSQRGKQRRYRYAANPLEPVAVINGLHTTPSQRVICVCNTVDRAQSLAQALKRELRLQGVRIELLHSRFYPGDRNRKEADIRREFGEDTARRQWGPTILVATQVIEVGLNVTCDVLHTEMAPASAIVQRAGRCARFTGESGEVIVYDVPLNDTGLPDYAPYLNPKRGSLDVDNESEGQARLCERTREALAALPVDGAILSYHDELDLVNQAHEPFDEQLLARLHDNRHMLRDQIRHVFSTQDRRAVRELIRDIDNRTIIVHQNPTEMTLPNPYRLEGIGMRRNALLKWYSQVQADAVALDIEWVIKVAVPTEDEADDASEPPERGRNIWTRWLAYPPSEAREDIRAGCDGIVSSGLIAVNPALVQYDTVFGFRFATGAPASDSPLASKSLQLRPDYGPIRRETYVEHIEGLCRVYNRTLRERSAAVQRCLEQRHALLEGTLDRAIRLMFAVHDLGKLDATWQRWAHLWQDKVSQLRGDATLVIPDEYMAAHTDFDHKTESTAEKKIQPRRPPHAAESARAGRALISAVAGACDALHVALMTAIICHHSVTLREDHGPWKPVPKHAKAAFNEAMRAVGLINDANLLAAVRASGASINWLNGFEAERSLSDHLINPADSYDLILYLVLVRILRLADQGSQERDEEVKAPLHH